MPEVERPGMPCQQAGLEIGNRRLIPGCCHETSQREWTVVTGQNGGGGIRQRFDGIEVGPAIRQQPGRERGCVEDRQASQVKPRGRVGELFLHVGRQRAKT